MAKKKVASTGEPAAKRPGKGGPRKGAGRKSVHDGGTFKLGLRVPQDVVQFASDVGPTQSAAITAAVRMSASYRNWKDGQQSVQ